MQRGFPTKVTQPCPRVLRYVTGEALGPVPSPLFLTTAHAPLAAAEDASGPGTSGLYVITAGTASLVQKGESYTLTLGSVSPQTVWFEGGEEEGWRGEKGHRLGSQGFAQPSRKSLQRTAAAAVRGAGYWCTRRLGRQLTPPSTTSSPRAAATCRHRCRTAPAVLWGHTRQPPSWSGSLCHHLTLPTPRSLPPSPTGARPRTSVCAAGCWAAMCA